MSPSTLSDCHKGLAIDEIRVAAYTIPTDKPESDGTLQWDSTTMVVVHATAADQTGFGYTYAPAAAARIVKEKLADAVIGQSAFNVNRCYDAMTTVVRNAGLPGVCAEAISAVDVALWDLKAKVLDLPLVSLWGAVSDSAPIYGSGGFTSYSDQELADQLAGWVAQGIPQVKMKVGRRPSDDAHRVAVARGAISDDSLLMVDANGGYDRKQALALAHRFAEEAGVVWFEEPRPSDDLAGLRLIRDRGPAGMDVAAGEYGYTPTYFRSMLQAGAVDCLQVDATRCGGFTGFFKAAALCEAFGVPLSAHCAPQLHAHAGCCASEFRHIEYFHDHVRIADLILDTPLRPSDGALRPDLSRPGHGLALKSADASRYEADC